VHHESQGWAITSTPMTRVLSIQVRKFAFSDFSVEMPTLLKYSAIPPGCTRVESRTSLSAIFYILRERPGCRWNLHRPSRSIRVCMGNSACLGRPVNDRDAPRNFSFFRGLQRLSRLLQVSSTEVSLPARAAIAFDSPPGTGPSRRSCSAPIPFGQELNIAPDFFFIGPARPLECRP